MSRANLDVPTYVESAGLQGEYQLVCDNIVLTESKVIDEVIDPYFLWIAIQDSRSAPSVSAGLEKLAHVFDAEPLETVRELTYQRIKVGFVIHYQLFGLLSAASAAMGREWTTHAQLIWKVLGNYAASLESVKEGASPRGQTMIPWTVPSVKDARGWEKELRIARNIAQGFRSGKLDLSRERQSLQRVIKKSAGKGVLSAPTRRMHELLLASIEPTKRG